MMNALTRDLKTPRKQPLKSPKTAHTNSSWEGLLSQGYLRLTFGGGGLIFRRAYF